VYALPDPGRVEGGGAQRLAEAGVEVIGGVLADEAEEFLHAWLTATRNRRPYVTVKWASSLDGRAAAADGSSQWITGPEARARVHEQRAASDAILVGTGTVFADDPTLTARMPNGELQPHQPLPVVVGERAIPGTAKLWEHPRGLLESGTRDLREVMGWMFDQGIRRAYVEGGPTLSSAVISAGLADEYLVFVAPKLLGGPVLALGEIGVGSIDDARELHITAVERLGDDILVTARPKGR
jgi:diaminohydroxyphosphoribosylaminopyrimidine deaminase/5-amino-6-(5-phosphoribosylamino)uracil reductase